MGYKHQVALLRIDGSPLIPTEISRKVPLEIGKLQHHRFDFGQTTLNQRLDSQQRRQLKNYYRHFKSDLTKNWSELKGPGSDSWAMKTKRTDADKERGAGSELIQQDGKNLTYFNARHAAEVFLYKVLEKTIHTIDRLFDSSAAIKVHLTAPVYDSDGKSKSKVYRNHLKELAGNLTQYPPINRVEIKVDARDILYEPYAIWQYYATIEKKIPDKDEVRGKSFLIFDMGGSTTDVALVQATQDHGKLHFYPTCRSIERAGEFFDRFLLKKMLDLDILPQASSKYNEILEQIEKAKIRLCDDTEHECELTFQDSAYTLTKAFIANALKEFWDDNYIRMGQEIRGFLQNVKRRMKQNGGIHASDKISGVFMAGGSTLLPGIEELIRGEVVRMGFSHPDEDFFVIPLMLLSNAELIPRSCLAALGQAVEMAETAFAEQNEEHDSFVLDRAEKLYMKVEDERGVTYTFPRKPRQFLQKEETFLFRVDELYEKEKIKFEERNGQNPYKVHLVAPNESLPNKNRLYFRNDLETSYPSDPHLVIDSHIRADDKYFSPTELQKVEKLIRFTCHVERQGEELKIKPFFCYKPRGPLSDWSRLDGKREHKPARISLKPESVIDKTLKDSAQPVHVCIDLGMNNTAVAIYAPGRTLPEDDPVLEVFNLFEAPLMQDEQETNEQQENYAEPEKTLPPLSGEIHSNGTGTSLNGHAPSPHADHWTSGFVEWVEKMAELRAEQHFSVDLQQVIDAIDQLKATMNPLEDIALALQTSNSIEHVPQQSWEDEIYNEITSSDRALSQQASEDTSFQAFHQFINEHEDGVFYSDSILRRVWTRCMSDEGQLVVLAGPPGSGKTSLVRLIAEFFNRDIDSANYPNGWEDYYLLQPVSPAWFSPASLLGSVNPLHGHFQATSFLRFLKKAEIHYEQFSTNSGQHRHFFACLDEFNIAQPEQYLADLLSKLEAPATSDARQLVLYEAARSESERSVKVKLTPNLKLFATLNTDLSTKMLSPKVLDRCFFLRLTPNTDVINQMAVRLTEKHRQDSPAIDIFHKAFASYFSELNRLSKLANTPIAFRALKQVYDYAARHPLMQDSLDNADLTKILEEVITSFFLPKLPAAHAVQNSEYVKVLKTQCTHMRKLKDVNHVLDHILNGFPGQAVL